MTVVMACFGTDWCCCGHTWSMSRAMPSYHPSARDVVGELVDSYCEWLLRERGLAATTVRCYQATARRFLAQRAGSVELNDLTAAEVSAVLVAISAHGSVGAAKGHVAEVRSLLGYCS